MQLRLFPMWSKWSNKVHNDVRAQLSWPNQESGLMQKHPSDPRCVQWWHHYNWPHIAAKWFKFKNHSLNEWINTNSYLFTVNLEMMQFRVKPIDYWFYSLIVLKKNKYKHKCVKNTNAKYNSPYCRVRSSERSIWEGKQWYYQEEKDHTFDTTPDIWLKIGLVTG